MTSFSSDNAYISELYARGYIFREGRPPEVADHWISDEFHGFYLAHDPRLDRQREVQADCEVLSLGTIFDVRRPDETSQECITRLVAALARSEEAFLDEVGYTCGRYVLAYRRADGSCFIIPDATGMKAIFYYCGTPRIIASHHNLILANAPNARLRNKIPMKFGYPGLRAPLSRSYMLTPNTKLDLSDFSVKRFWPIASIMENNLEAATDIVHANMRGAIDFFLKQFRPVVSITAGLDSRLTLSFLRNSAGVHYFSYYRNDDIDTDLHDHAFARELRDDFGRDVRIIELSKEVPPDPDFLKVQDRNTFYDHIKRISWIYYRQYGGDPDVIHVRSNISGVGRETYRSRKFHIQGSNDLARLYLYENREYKSSYIFDVIKHFEEFDEMTGLTNCGKRVDLKSLFYWEHRLPAWHSQVVAESDPAFDTLSIFNCRNTLETMLSVPKKDRLNSMIWRKIIYRNWKELTELPVNGKPFWPEAAYADHAD